MNPLWQQLAARASLTLTQEQLDHFDRYLALLLAANERMNLTRIDTLEQAQIGHIGDTLTLLPFLPPGPFTCADVGSGGGVPGIPLAISRPSAHITLIESTQKKAVFLNEVIRELDLKNVRVNATRAEDEAKDAMRESFNIVTARALAPMNVLVEWCLPLVKLGGKLLAMKGAKISDELPAATRAIQLLGGAEPIVHPANLPGSDFHVIVEIKKIHPTNKRYPRPTAQIKDKPL